VVTRLASSTRRRESGPLTLDVYRAGAARGAGAAGDRARGGLFRCRLRRGHGLPLQGHGHVHDLGKAGGVVRDGRGDVRQRAPGGGSRGVLRYVREHAAELGIDAERLALWGCRATVRWRSRRWPARRRQLRMRRLQLRLSRGPRRRDARGRRAEAVALRLSRRLPRGERAGRSAGDDCQGRRRTGPRAEHRARSAGGRDAGGESSRDVRQLRRRAARVRGVSTTRSRRAR
jgi:hypothetical protein